MNLNEIHLSQIEDKYEARRPDYREIGEVFDLEQRVIILDYKDYQWLIDKVKELLKDKD